MICPACGNEAGDGTRAIKGVLICASCRHSLIVNEAGDGAVIANIANMPKDLTDAELKTLQKQRRAR